MADIVERLRNISGEAGDHGDVVLCTDAADEIERLRTQGNGLADRVNSLLPNAAETGIA